MSAVHVSPRQPLLAVNFGHLSAYEKLSFASQSGDLGPVGEASSVFVHFHQQNSLVDERRKATPHAIRLKTKASALRTKPSENWQRRKRPISPTLEKDLSPHATSTEDKEVSMALADVSPQLSAAIDATSLKHLRGFSDGDTFSSSNPQADVDLPLSSNKTRGISTISLVVPPGPNRSMRVVPTPLENKQSATQAASTRVSQGISSSSSSKIPLRRASTRQLAHAGCWVRWCCQPQSLQQEEKQCKGIPPLEFKSPHRVSIPDGTAFQLDKLLPREWVEGTYDTTSNAQPNTTAREASPRKESIIYEREVNFDVNERTHKVTHDLGSIKSESYSSLSSSEAYGSGKKDEEEERDAQLSLQNYLAKITITPTSLDEAAPRRKFEAPNTIPLIAPWARRAAAESSIQKASLVHLKLKSEAKRKLGSNGSGSNLSQRSQQGSRVASFDRLGDSDLSVSPAITDRSHRKKSRDLTARTLFEASYGVGSDQHSLLTPPSWLSREKDSQSRSTTTPSDELSISQSPLPHVPLKSLEPLPRCRSIRVKNATNPARITKGLRKHRPELAPLPEESRVFGNMIKPITTNINLQEPEAYLPISTYRRRSEAQSGSSRSTFDHRIGIMTSTNATATIKSSMSIPEERPVNELMYKMRSQKSVAPRKGSEATTGPVPILRGDNSPSRRRDSSLPKLTFCLPNSANKEMSNASSHETPIHSEAINIHNKSDHASVTLPLSFFHTHASRRLSEDASVGHSTRRSTKSARMYRTRTILPDATVTQAMTPQKGLLHEPQDTLSTTQTYRTSEPPTSRQNHSERSNGTKNSRIKHKHRDPNWLPDRNYRRNSAEEFMFEYSSLSSLTGLTSSTSSAHEIAVQSLNQALSHESVVTMTPQMSGEQSIAKTSASHCVGSNNTIDSKYSPTSWVPEPSRPYKNSIERPSPKHKVTMEAHRGHTWSTDGLRSAAQSTYHASDMGSTLSAFMRGPRPRLRKADSARTRIAQIRFDKSVPCMALILKPDGKLHLQQDFAIKLTTTHLLLSKGKQSKAYDLKELCQVDASRRPLHRAKKKTAEQERHMWDDTDDVIDSLEASRTVCTLRFADRKVPVIVAFESKDDLNDFVELLGLHTQGYTDETTSHRKVIFYYPKS